MNKPGRIWLLSNEFEPHIIGGLGTAVTSLAKAYVQSGTHITVISQNKHPHIHQTSRKNLQIIRFPLKTAYYSSSTKQFKPAAIENGLNKSLSRKPKGIHIHSVQFKNVAKYYQAKHRIPVIYTCHSLIQLEPGPLTRKQQTAITNQVELLKLANKIVVPSRSEKTKLVKLYPFCAKKTVVIYHGIVKRKAAKTRARPHRLLFVGRLVPSKGIMPLLKAIAQIKREGNKVQLDLVGKGASMYMRYLNQQIQRLGISSEVKLLGFREQSQVQKMYSAYGAVVMPSLQESFGLVALEALASGVPLVSTRSGGLSEFVNSKVAQTIPTVKSHAIAKAIKTMWNDREQTDRRVRAGLKLAARFQWPTAASKYKKLFKHLPR